MRVLRLGAVGVALVGIVDPSVPTGRKVLPSVDVRVGRHGSGGDVQQRLVEALQKRVEFNGADVPAARVLIGDAAGGEPAIQDGVPVSGVSVATEHSPNVRILAVKGPRHVPVGWTAAFEVRVEGLGMRGSASTLILEDRGTEVTRIEHKWTSDVEIADLALRYAPPIEGTTPMTVRAESSIVEADGSDNRVDVALRAIGRKLRVLVHEPRPSWSSTFIRRAIERNPTFDVAVLTHPSRGPTVSAGSPPAGLSADALAAFAVVVLGAPEELRSTDVDSMRTFMRTRGGRVVLLPDRRPAGPVLQLLPVQRFDEMLVENPIELKVDGGSLSATELVVPTESGDVDVLAAASIRGHARPVVFAARAGLGQVIFSGALDAWRFRASGNGGFAAFWESRIAEAALAAPPRLDVALSPGVAAPGEEVTVQVRVRPTEFLESADAITLLPITARVVGKDLDRAIRLWPSAEIGRFTGTVSAPAAGRYDVQVTSGDATTDAPLLSMDDSRSVNGVATGESDRVKLIAESTGGIAATADDLSALEAHLASLPAGVRAGVIHPSRSLWFVLAFAALACAEWTLRRRKGLV
jgi:hypothetical protein